MIRSIRSGFAGLGNPNRGVFLVVLGFGVRIHPSFWLIAFLFGMQRSAHVGAVVEWVLVVLVSIVVHELGHAFVAGRWGVVHRISVHGAGGETTWRPLLEEAAAWKHIAVSLAGPAAGFGLALVVWLLQPYLRSHWLVGLAARDLVQVNLFWGVFNLLPIVPLDGGKALKVWLSERWGERGEWVASGIGLVTAIVGLVAALAAGQPIAGVMLGIYGIHSGQVFRGFYEAHRDKHRHTKWHRPLGRDQVRERY